MKQVFLEAIRYYYGHIAAQVFGDAPDMHSMIEYPSQLKKTEAAGKKGKNAKTAEGTLRDPREYLNAIIGQLYAAHDISPQLHREITGMRYRDPDVDRLIQEEEQKTVVRLRKLLESMRPVLAVEDVEAAALLVHHSAEELIHSIKIFGSPIEPQRLIGELNTMLSRYLFRN
jgi:hypothetical protein